MKEFSEAAYVSVRTFRANGDPVATPVWPAVLDGKLYFGTPVHTHKVRRIGNNRQVEVAVCDARGATSGPWRAGTARRLTDQEFDAAKRAIDRRHPIAGRIMNLVARLRRWDYIGIEVVSSADRSDDNP